LESSSCGIRCAHTRPYKCNAKALDR